MRALVDEKCPADFAAVGINKMSVVNSIEALVFPTDQACRVCGSKAVVVYISPCAEDLRDVAGAMLELKRPLWSTSTTGRAYSCDRLEVEITFL
jgi:hypothetical protein